MCNLKEQMLKEVTIDFIGPLRAIVRGKPCEFHILTATNTVTSLVEIARIDRKTSGDHDFKICTIV